MSSAPSESRDPPWIAEREVDARTALALIRDACPALQAGHIEPFGTGWDNTAWLVDGTWVFRFPRREIAVDLLRAETRALPLIAPHLPLPIPVPEHVGAGSDRFPWPFAGYRMLSGHTACRAALDEHARTALAAPLASFLSALHTLPGDLVQACGAPLDTIDRLALPRRALAARERLEQAVQAGLLSDARPWLELVADLPESWSPRTDHLVHGDLYARHLLVDGAGAPAGIIDWGDVHRGEPALDLSIAYGFLPGSARQQFFDIYRDAVGEVDGLTHRMACFKALYTSATLLVYGHDIDDDDLRREGRLGLDYVLQDAQHL